MPNSSDAVRTRWAAAGIFAFALALRVWHLLNFSRLVYADVPFGDAKSYVDAAADIAAHGPWAGPAPYFQGPLFPLTLGFTTALGLTPTAWLWIQAGIGSATALGVFVLGRRLFGLRSGVIAGALYAAYDVAIFFDADLLAASLTTALVVWGLVATVRLVESPSTRSGWLAGAALGLAAWGRPNLLLPALIVAMTLVWGARGRARERPRRPLAGLRPFLIALAVTFALPVVRNVVMTGNPVFTTGGGVNAYIGNHPGATGTFRIPPESGLSNDLDLGEMSRVVASQRSGRDLTAGEASRWWFGRAMDSVVRAPLDAAGWTGKKVLWLLNREDVSNHLDIARIREGSVPMRATPIRSWVLLALSAAGAVFAWRVRGARVVFVYALGVVLSVLPFFITARYRLTLMPIAALFAGALVAPESVASIRSGRGRVAAALFLGAIGLAWVPLGSGRNRASTYVNEGALYMERGDRDAAHAAFRQALKLAPNDPRAHLNLASLAIEAGHPDEAVAHTDVAVRLEPTNPRAWNSRGIALGEARRFDAALEAFDRAEALLPSWSEPAINRDITWARYRAHCQALVTAAGIAPPTTRESAQRVIEFLVDQGYLRAAEDLRIRLGQIP